MSISRLETLYARIFEVKVLQDYHLESYIYDGAGVPIVNVDATEELAKQYDVRKDMVFVPTAATALLMQRTKMLMKTTAQGFYIGMQVKEDGTDYSPARKIDSNFVLQFEIHVKNPMFFNYSDLPMEGLGEEEVTTGATTQYFRNYYYFTNRDNKYPNLCQNTPLRQGALNATNDIQSEQTLAIRPDAMGLIEINAFALGGSPANILENNVLNISKTGNEWTWPTFELTIQSRKVYWYIIDSAGVSQYRSRHRMFMSKIQINPIRIQGIGDELNVPNPSPQNMKWYDSIGEYVAEVYLPYQIQPA